MNWTQPLCAVCWQNRRTGHPNRMLIPEPETCCICGQETEAGIYIRIDPETVPYPSADE